MLYIDGHLGSLKRIIHTKSTDLVMFYQQSSLPFQWLSDSSYSKTNFKMNALQETDDYSFNERILYEKQNVLNATFNSISALSLWSVLLVEETRVPGENHQPAACH